MVRLVVLLLLLSFSVKAQKKNPDYYFQKGQDALDAQSYKTALAHFNECLRLDPYYIDAYYYRAQARENLGDKQGALTDFNIYIESKPKDADALFARAQLRYQYRQWAMAREDFLKLLTLPAGETKSIFFAPDKEGGLGITTAQSHITSSVLNYLGLVDTQLKNYKRAIQYLDSAVKLEPSNAEFYINRGWAWQEMNDTLHAVQDYRKALSINPEGSIARHNLAVLSAAKGNLREMEKLLNEANERNAQEPRYFTARASNQTALHNFQQAMEDYSMSIQLDNTNPDVWLRRGVLQMQMKNWNGALADFTQCIKLKEDQPQVWLYRGNLMMEMNRIKEAIEDYTIAIAHQPDWGKPYAQRARAYQKTGNQMEACQDIKKAELLKEPIDQELKSSLCR
ncbi:MAG: tetratricopeptide repeat protein [Bacteroidetes bacterium]|nr:tetratricopeptide repeat protein [Bacteroidota bacterium]MBS1541990.1 tetratricopeptide repeat protein [Bacteroidota bacterium]